VSPVILICTIVRYHVGGSFDAVCTLVNNFVIAVRANPAL
jgi:hypothetical protein